MSIFHRMASMAVAMSLVFNSLAVGYAQEQATSDDTYRNQIFLPLIKGGTAAEAEQSDAQQSDAEQIDVPSPDLSQISSRVDQLIIRLRSDSVEAASVDRVTQIDALSQAVGVNLAYEREMSGEAFVVRLPSVVTEEEARKIAEQLSTLPEVEYAEPDLILYPVLVPNDPSYTQQWHYVTPSTGNYGINLPPAWDVTTGLASTVVAVIDTGYRPHADLVGRFVGGYDFVTDVKNANDTNGRDSDALDPGDWITAAESPSFCGSFAPARNSTWHGTHVAGTIAANSNNNSGVAGINWSARILPVRVLGKCGGNTSDIIDGINWAAGLSVPNAPANSNPAKVINMSLGGQGVCSVALQSAINAVVAVGTTVVVAAGNFNTNASNFHPANCANVITVSSTNRNGSRAYYSNYDSSVEISAPGGEINAKSINGVLSTLNTGKTVPADDAYVFYQGTSMAAPHVAGVVSLLLAINPSLTPAQILTFLQANVTPFPAGSNCTTANCGKGIVNAALAVNAVNAAKLPTLRINDIIVNESAGNATLTVSLSQASTQVISVNYATSNWTALAGSDYTASSGTRSILAGSTSTTIVVPILKDNVVESAENFIVSLSGAVNATIAKAQGIVTIR